MKTVFFDVDTLIDFVFPAGALYVPGAEHRLGAVAALTRHAAAHGIPVISTADAHAENDPEFRSWPAHCVKGTLGQRKPDVTLLENRVVIPADAAWPVPALAQQVIVEKRTLDCFDSPHLRPLLDRLAADRYVVYGFVTEYCVRYAALGLLATGRRVELAKDAIQYLRQQDADRTLAEFTAAGGILTTVAEVCR
ncbi:MAG: cysteine hydrolase family protein [Bryobacterales bacterium]|nr:cysteine hydrolase family protein [Bryobacterales bacterium]